MKDTMLVRKQPANDQARAELAAEPTAGEIRLLDELELALAGGGDLGDNWP